jgi:hypothetical protein
MYSPQLIIVKYISVYFLILLFLSCTNQGPRHPQPFQHASKKVPLALLASSTPSYAEAKAQMLALRNKTRQQLASGTIDSTQAGALFTEGLLTSLIPHWYGTPWDFNGYTDTPKQGKIACGYFVSTTLLHAGIELDRYKLAQQGPLDEAIALSLHKGWRTFSGFPAGAMAQKIKEELKEGLYFIGLGESHVGYLLKKEGELYLIHANYTGDAVVTIQPLMQSVFQHFTTWYIAEITYNRALLGYWLSGKKCVLPYPNLATQSKK